MATDYVVAAYYLGNTGSDGGKAGEPAIATVVTLTDENMDDTIAEGEDTIDGFTISALKDQSTIELENGLTVTGWYIEHEDASGDKEIYFVPTDGTVPSDSVLAEDSEQNGDQEGDPGDLTPIPPPPCFAAGTRITTETGPLPIESLGVGDRVQTRDHGIQKIRWIGRATLDRKMLSKARFTRPIRIKRGALGRNLPKRDLYLSPMHRVLSFGPQINLLFAENEAFAAAKFLTPLEGVSQQNPKSVTYYHLLFDRHEVIQSEGVWTESLYLGENSAGGFDQDQLQELCCLFPELIDDITAHSMVLARRDLRKFEMHAAL